MMRNARLVMLMSHSAVLFRVLSAARYPKCHYTAFTGQTACPRPRYGDHWRCPKRHIPQSRHKYTLRIDRFCSFVAVELFGDFTRYFDPGFLVFCHMTKRVFDMFRVEGGEDTNHSQAPAIIQFISERIKDISGENDDIFGGISIFTEHTSYK